MRRTILTSLLTAFTLFASTAFAATYYVATTGADSNPGTSSQPWRTIQKAADTLFPGDIVVVLSGVYHERVQITTSGRSGQEITYKVNGTDEVWCDGFTLSANYVTLDGFKIDSDANDSKLGVGIYVSGDFDTVRNCYVTECPWGGIRLTGSSSNCILEYNQCYHNGLYGITMCGTDNTAQYNKVWESVQYHEDGGPPEGWGADADGFRIHGSGHTIRGNYIPYPALISDPASSNPHIDAFQTFEGGGDETAARNCTFEYNYVINEPNSGGGRHMFMWEGTSGPTYIRYNVFVGNDGVNANSTTSNMVITNNTWISQCDETDNDPIPIEARGSNITAKNNLTICFKENHRYITNSTGRAVDYNWLYNTDGSVRVGTPSLQANEIKDTDPELSNLSGGQYWPSPGSGLIDSGDDLGTQRGLLPASSWTSWPIKIVTADQDSNGSGWEIGAYVYEEGGDSVDTEAPTVPENLAASKITQDSVLLSWSASTDDHSVSGYHVFRDGQFYDTTEASSYSDLGLDPSTQYLYQVSAFDAAGNESAKSASLGVLTEALTYFSPGDYVEAEAGTLTSTVQVNSDRDASGGKYVFASTEESGTVSFTFEITEAGIYSMKAKVLAADTGRNSFYVGVDSESASDSNAYIYDTQISQVFVWDDVSLRGATGDHLTSEFDPKTWDLTEGLHTFTFYAREADTRLDQITLSVFGEDDGAPSPPTGLTLVSGL